MSRNWLPEVGDYVQVQESVMYITDEQRLRGVWAIRRASGRGTFLLDRVVPGPIDSCGDCLACAKYREGVADSDALHAFHVADLKPVSPLVLLALQAE